MRPALQGAIAAGLLFASTTAAAQPWGIFDVRAAGMGGVGVASGSQYASFNNPALLATAGEEHDWFLISPTLGRQRGDPDSLKDHLDDLQSAMDDLAASPTTANAAAVQARIDDLRDARYRAGGNTAVLLAIPSRLLSGAAFIHLYDWATSEARIGGDDLTDPANPQYRSGLRHRGIRVLENGVSTATTFSGHGWRQGLAVGFNFKFQFLQGYGYDETVDVARAGLRHNDYRSTGNFNADLGILKSMGVWKLGLMVRNLANAKVDYGDSGERFELTPQARAGFAYQSRRTVVEMDVDLLQYDPIGADDPQQSIALGLEQRVWHWLTLRTGWQQNLRGKQAGGPSLGLGLSMGPLLIDLAAYHTQQLDGAHAQIAFQF